MNKRKFGGYRNNRNTENGVDHCKHCGCLLLFLMCFSWTYFIQRSVSFSTWPLLLPLRVPWRCFRGARVSVGVHILVSILDRDETFSNAFRLMAIFMAFMFLLVAYLCATDSSAFHCELVLRSPLDHHLIFALSLLGIAFPSSHRKP